MLLRKGMHVWLLLSLDFYYFEGDFEKKTRKTKVQYATATATQAKGIKTRHMQVLKGHKQYHRQCCSKIAGNIIDILKQLIWLKIKSSSSLFKNPTWLKSNQPSSLAYNFQTLPSSYISSYKFIIANKQTNKQNKQHLHWRKPMRVCGCAKVHVTTYLLTRLFT